VDCLRKTRDKNGLKFSGIVYLRDITDSKMKGTELKNLSVFRHLCGTASLRNVVIVTTKWDMLKGHSIGKAREQE
jgi:hypothetical protein